MKGKSLLKSKVGLKLLTILLLVAIVPIITLGYFSYNKSFEILEEKLSMTTGQIVNNLNREINTYIEQREHDTESLATLAAESLFQTTFSSYNNPDLKQIERNTKSMSDVLNTYIILNDNTLYIFPNKLIGAGLPTNLPWYQEAVKNDDRVIWTNAEKNKEGQLTLYVAKAIKHNGQTKGAVGMEVEINGLAEKFANVPIGRTGYLTISDSDGLVLTHPDQTMIGESFIEYSFWDDVKNTPSDFIEYNFQGKDKFLSFTTNEKIGWKLLGTMEIDELLNDTKQIKGFIILVVGIAAVISMIVAFLAANQISSPLSQLQAAFNTAADGDLTTRVKIKSRDEFGDVGNSFNDMINNISLLVKEVAESSNIVENKSQQLSSTVEELTAQMHNINTASQEIASGMEETSASTEEINASGQDVAVSVTDLAQKAKEGNKAVNEIENRAREIKDNAVKSSDLAKTMYTDKQTRIVKAIEDGKVVMKIENMAKIISDIAEQTSLLALNASIEAARAGEHGRGFAVVADEIRKLADESNKTVTEIHDLVKKVMDSFDNLSNNANEILTFIDEKVTSDYKMLEETGVQYQKDAEYIGNLFDQFAANTGHISVAVEQINKAIEMVATTAQQTAASSSEISNNTGDISMAVDDLANISQQQSDLAHQLNMVVRRFKL